MGVRTPKCEVLLFYKEEGGKRIMPGVKPVFKTKGAACADVTIPYAVRFAGKCVTKVDLWIGFQIPEGYCIKIYPRSSLLVNYRLITPVSIIDEDYRGHVHVPVYNPTDDIIELEAGTRIAQVELVKRMQHIPDCWDVDYQERGQEGFGTTGR